MLAQLTSQVAIENTLAALLLKEQTLHLAPRLKGHKSTTTKPRVADARPIDPIPLPIQNQPVVAEPVSHYEKEI
jgi:hypothetical protein